MRALLLLLITLIIPTVAAAVPTVGAGGVGASKTAWIASDVKLVPSVTSGEAPLDVDFEIQITGSQIGQSDYYVFCNDDDVNILMATGIRYPDYPTDTSAVFDVDGLCHYKSAGVKTPQLFINFRGWLPTISETVTVTEPTGAITVELDVDPLVSTELTDLTLTATVTGETGNINCKFWCDDDTVAYADVDNDGTGNSPQASSPVTDTTSCVNLTVGEYVASIACQRGAPAQEDTASIPYTVGADSIGPVFWGCTPAQGVVADMGAVECTAEFSTSCDPTGTFDISFDATDNGVAEYTDAGINLADYADEDGLVTWNISDNNAAYDFGALGAATYTAEVTIDCENAVQVTRDFDVVVEAAPPTDTLWFHTGPSPKTCMENDCVGRDQWLYAIDGTADGTVTNLSLYCDNGAPEPDYSALGPFTPNSDAAPATTESFLITEADGTPATCDYTTSGTYTQQVTATRDSVTHTSSDDWEVTDVVDNPIWDISQTYHEVLVQQGTDPSSPVTFDICNRGETRMDWAETAGGETEAWLSCTPDATAENGGLGLDLDDCETITCTRTTNGLDTGDSYAYITYEDADASPPESPTVTFKVIVYPAVGDSPINLRVDIGAPAADQGGGNYIASGPSPFPVSFSVADTGNHLGLSDSTPNTSHENTSISENFFNAIHYQWDFGDDTGATWTPTGNSRNNMTGPLGAHVYEPTTFPDTCLTKACKIYYPTLLATDSLTPPNTATWSAIIHVYDPDGGY